MDYLSSTADGIGQAVTGYGGGDHDNNNSTDETTWLLSSSRNETFVLRNSSLADIEYIFDRKDVQAIFITLYTIVFCSCFVGNALVILVVTLHWRMRSITNFCLGNLAVADFCVGVFCVYQNLSTYLIARFHIIWASVIEKEIELIDFKEETWIFGEAGCKLYHFVNTLSHTASILILVVICIERYLAIIHPIRCKQMLTLNRLRLTIVAVWVLSALYSSPRLYYINTVTIPRHDGEVEVMCIPKRTLYDSVTFDLISLMFLFIIPLVVLSVLYTRIGIALWRSSQNRMPTSSTSETSSSSFLEPPPQQQQQQQHFNNCHYHQNQQQQHDKKFSVKALPCYWPCLNCFNHMRRCCRGGGGGGGGGHYHRSLSSQLRKSGGGGENLRHGGVDDVHNNFDSSVTPCSNDICNHCHHTIQLQVMGGRESEPSGQNHYPSIMRNTTTSIGNNIPASPYSLRERRAAGQGGGTMTAINNTKLVIKTEDPIVVVKFEKTSSFRRNSRKRNRCTILMNSSNNFANVDEESSGTCTDSTSPKFLNGSYHPHPHHHHHCNGNDHFFHGGGHQNQLECTTCFCSDKAVLSESSPNSGVSGGVGSRLLCCHSPRKQDVVLLSNGACSLLTDKNFDWIPPSSSTSHSHDGGGGSCCGACSCSCNHPTGQMNNPMDSVSCPSTPVALEGGQQVCKLKRLRVIRSSKYGTKALQSRRRIIKMLMVVVFAFGFCNAPFHFRKIWQNWSKSYDGGSTLSTILTPLTFLIMYANSGVSPIIYIVMSTTFRASLRDLLHCNMRRSLRVSRKASARSTHLNPLSTAA